MFYVILRVALRELRGAMLRSLLTMLGVVIGVAAVVAMVALGEGAKISLSKNIRNLGTNLLIVRPGIMQEGHVRHVTAQTLTRDDARLIEKKIPEVIAVAPSNSRQAQVKRLNKNTSTNIVGTTPAHLSVRSLNVKSGRFFTHRDVIGARRVAALGLSVAETLFGSREAVGEYIKINGINFRVTAVMAEKGQSGWRDADDQILIPISTFQKRLFGGTHVSFIWVEVKSEELMATASEEITSLLRRSHGIKRGEEPDFHVRSQIDILKSMEEMTRTFRYLLAGIAAISLLVGGIGIMNIMLVTVTERTREIGLRKALGAKRNDILKQFLLESATLSGLGGILGILLGSGIAYVIGNISEWGTHISPESVLIAYSVALVVGIFFGWYPAFKAARMNPVDALRRE